MSVYVDKMFKPYGRMHMCHLVADNHEELLAMVERIGVDKKWIQEEGNYREHFDICKSKRVLALELGAKEVTSRELIAIIRRKKELHVAQSQI